MQSHALLPDADFRVPAPDGRKPVLGVSLKNTL
jgi:hypothetical protein